MRRVRDGFLVSAEHWEFEVLRQRQSSTNAKRATINFVEAKTSSEQSLPGWSTYIKVEMPECSAAYWELLTWARIIGEKLNERGWKHHGERIQMFAKNDEGRQSQKSRIHQSGHSY